MDLLRKHIILIYSLLIATKYASGQEMSDGFRMLEEGRFENAKTYFNQVLNEYPSNKTAKLCYGRAVGLSGNAAQGTSIFIELLEAYPNDIEVELNLAESYLWQQNPIPAIPIYNNLIANDSSLFGAQLGLANSYSMAKEYKTAYEVIKSALALDAKNQQARLSAKYIRLGYANELASVHHQYDSAIRLINLNLEADNQDQESLSLLANVYIISKEYEKAGTVYADIKQPIASVKGRSTTLHLLEENEEALECVVSALQKSWTEEQQVELTLHLVTALLWNNELIAAREKVDSLARLYPLSKEVLAKQADVAMYEADFIRAIEHFDEYLFTEPESFSANLGKANAMAALGVDRRAYDLGFFARRIFPGQLDIENFIDKLDVKHSPTLYSEYTFGKASDGSVIRSIESGSTASLDAQTTIGLSYEHRTFLPPTESPSSNTDTYAITVQRQINKRIRLKASYGSIGISIQGDTDLVRRSDIDIEAEAWVSKATKLSFGYQTEIQNFNASLINQNIRTRHLVAKSIVFWKPRGIGWYSEVYQSFFSDGNTRSLLFTSLYKSTASKPSIKYGANFLWMTFSVNRPLDYYSPRSFLKPELFGGIEHSIEDLSVSYGLEGAASYQFVDGDNQPNFRVQAKISKVVGAFSFQLSGLYTTITATQASGFSYMEMKGKIIWRFIGTPLFRNKDR